MEIKKVFFSVQFKRYICICKERRGHLKFVALLEKEKGKAAMNEWENDDS